MKINTGKKIIFCLCLSICLIWLPYAIFFQAKINHIATLKKTIAVKEKQLVAMINSQKKYTSEKTAIKNQESELSLAEKLEEISVDLNLFENLQTINEQNSDNDEIKLQIRFQGISYTELIEFLEYTDNLPRIISIASLEINADRYLKHALNVTINLKEKIIDL